MLIDTGIISRKVFTRMSHAERINYDIFVEQLVQQTILSINLSCSSSSNSSSSSDCSPSQLAATVYGSAVLGVSSTELITAVLQATVVSLSQAAAEVQAAADSERTGMLQTGATFNNRQQQQQPSPATPPPAGSAADVCGWGPSEVASLMWGLGTLGGQRPDPQWLEHMTTVSGQIMSRCAEVGRMPKLSTAADTSVSTTSPNGRCVSAKAPPGQALLGSFV